MDGTYVEGLCQRMLQSVFFELFNRYLEGARWDMEA